MKTEVALRALASDKRLQILEWLKHPRKHFPPQVDGDLVKDGVCGVFIAEKLQVSQPTASEHLKILYQAGFLRAKRIKQWTFYKRDEPAIKAMKRSVLGKI
jgi:DNA-binding transcriptional ArsR family regulator